MDREVLRQWLKAGFVEKGRLFPTRAGTPQGGVISPLLANWTLDGLEATVKGLFGRRPKVHVIRYADDFVVVAETKEILEQTVKPAIQKFLAERGLRLSEETHPSPKALGVEICRGFYWGLRRLSGKRDSEFS
jgi:RNA-directed DNA polymerase